MEDKALQNKMRILLDQELVRRLMNRYFYDKGLKEDYDKEIYPPMLQDMLQMAPQLSGKVEIEPHVINLDQNTDSVELGWNLFVLGNQRMYLGESRHKSFSEVTGSIQGPLTDKGDRGTRTTPRRIVEFIVRVLGNSKNGRIDIGAEAHHPAPTMGGISSGQMYSQQSSSPKFVN